MIAERKSVLGINREFCPECRPILPQQGLDRGGLNPRSPHRAAAGVAPEGLRQPLHRSRGHCYRQSADRPLGEVHQGRGMVLGTCRPASQDRPRLPDRHLCVQQREHHPLEFRRFGKRERIRSLGVDGVTGCVLRHYDLVPWSGRRLSAPRGPGPDAAHVRGHAGVQSADGSSLGKTVRKGGSSAS